MRDKEDIPSGLCTKTYDIANKLEPNEVLVMLDRYCRKDAAFLCLKKYGFRLHQQTLEWLAIDNSILDFLA